MENVVLEVSKAEMEMIRVQREKEYLAKQEQEAKAALQLEKDILELKKSIESDKREDQEQIAATENYFKQFI